MHRGLPRDCFPSMLSVTPLCFCVSFCRAALVRASIHNVDIGLKEINTELGFRWTCCGPGLFFLAD